MFVFVVTWFLHAYQWFWLRGTILFVWQDILFWAILGLLVVVNSLWEMKHGRERKLGKASWTWRASATLTLKTIATFSFICVLWSFWMTESIAAWLSLWSAVGVEVARGPRTGPGRSGCRDAGRGHHRRWRRVEARGATACLRTGPRRSTAASLVALLAVGIEDIYTHYGPKVASFIQPLRTGQLSRLDTATLERGYYEQLMQVDRFNSQLWDVYAKRPKSWLDAQGGQLKRHTGGFAGGDLIPSFVATLEFGKVSTNRWGMRDQDYELKPAPGTFRAAVLGASSVMGWGVGDGETFEALVEERLNREQAGAPFAKYEILNFGIPGYQPPQQLVALEKALAFSPDAVFYVATGREISRAAQLLVEVVQKRIEIPVPRSQGDRGEGGARGGDGRSHRTAGGSSPTGPTSCPRFTGASSRRRAPAGSCRFGSSSLRSGRAAGRKRRPRR